MNYKGKPPRRSEARSWAAPTLDPVLVMEARHREVAIKREKRIQLRKQQEDFSKRRSSTNDEVPEPSSVKSIKKKKTSGALRHQENDPNNGNTNNVGIDNKNKLEGNAIDIEMGDELKQELKQEGMRNNAVRREQLAAHQKRKHECRNLLRHHIEKRANLKKKRMFFFWKFMVKLRRHLKEIEKRRLRIKSNTFATWSQLLIVKNRSLKKAQAANRWRILSKTWDRWRKQTLLAIAQREAARYDDEKKEMRRKMITAEKKFTRTCLSRYFLSWILWLKDVREEKLNDQAHKRRKEKAMRLLELLSKRQEEKQQSFSLPPTPPSAPSSKSSTSCHRPEAIMESSSLETLPPYVKMDVNDNPNGISSSTPEQQLASHPASPSRQSMKSSKPPSTSQSSISSSFKPKATPKTLLAMEERNARRRERREALKAHYEALEREKLEEKLRQAKELEDEQIRAKAAAYEQKKQEKREARQRAAQIEIEKEAFREKMKLSRLHYSFSLLKRKGFDPWKQLLSYSKICEKKAYTFYSDGITEKYWNYWCQAMHIIKAEKKAQRVRQRRAAMDLYCHIIRRRFWKIWLRYHAIYQDQEKEFVCQTQKYIMYKHFSIWLRKLRDIHIVYRQKHLLVTERSNYYLKHFVFRKWRESIESQQLLRAMELERRKTLEKVRTWLDDFNSPKAPGSVRY